MIVRSKELKNFIGNVTNFNGFLIYGPDKGKVKENANNIIKKLQSDYSFGNVKVLNEDLEKNILLDLIFQKDIFSEKSIIKIDLDLVKSIKLDRDFFSSLISNTNNILLLEAGTLNKNDPMTKNDILDQVWHYSSDADTHTVETHIYRLRKKINDKFSDEKFILNNKKGYYL